MGEALITRAGGEAEGVLPLIPGYHTALVTLKTPDGVPITNHTVKCTDGNSVYNYTTNEKGQCIFMCNSGHANFLINNVINSIRYIDIKNTWINVPAVVGTSNKINLKFEPGGSVNFTSNSIFGIMKNRNVNFFLEGGGGGGPMSDVAPWGGYYGGASGYVNKYNFIEKGIYNFISGSGKQSGGGTGGTSYIANTNYSAAGGTAGTKTSGGSGYRSGTTGNQSAGYIYGHGGAGYYGNYGSGAYGGTGTSLYSGSSGTFGGGGGVGTRQTVGTAYGGKGGDGFIHFDAFKD